MDNLLQIGLLPVVLTLFAFQAGRWVQSKLKLAVFNPILVGMVFVIVFLKATGMTVASYQNGIRLISWLITPATVCLAIPMYEQLKALGSNLKAIAAGVAAGAASCLGMLIVFSVVLGLDRQIAVSILPKGITVAIGMPLVELFGGIPSITTLGISVAGLTGNMFGPLFCKWFRITDPIAQGVAFGTASHVVGTARASELDPLIGAVSSLSLVIAGLLTAVVFPVLTAMLV